jgi:hypothetical protein
MRPPLDPSQWSVDRPTPRAPCHRGRPGCRDERPERGTYRSRPGATDHRIGRPSDAGWPVSSAPPVHAMSDPVRTSGHWALHGEQSARCDVVLFGRFARSSRHVDRLSSGRPSARAVEPTQHRAVLETPPSGSDPRSVRCASQCVGRLPIGDAPLSGGHPLELLDDDRCRPSDSIETTARSSSAFHRCSLLMGEPLCSGSEPSGLGRSDPQRARALSAMSSPPCQTPSTTRRSTPSE